MSIFLAFFVIAVLRSQFEEEVVNIKSPVSSVAAAVESERPYYTLIAPAPQGVGVDVKNTGYFVHRQQRRYFTEFTVSFHRFSLAYVKVCIITRDVFFCGILNIQAML
jgi:hypothetical protein